MRTVQVDSIGRGDKIIPSNVARAANLFQRNGLIIRGEKQIMAEEPKRTAIIGNYRYDYRDKKIDVKDASWLKRVFRAAHTKMEYDPEVWAKVEEIILGEIREMRGDNQRQGLGAGKLQQPWPNKGMHRSARSVAHMNRSAVRAPGDASR